MQMDRALMSSQDMDTDSSKHDDSKLQTDDVQMHDGELEQINNIRDPPTLESINFKKDKKYNLDNVILSGKLLRRTRMLDTEYGFETELEQVKKNITIIVNIVFPSKIYTHTWHTLSTDKRITTVEVHDKTNNKRTCVIFSGYNRSDENLVTYTCGYLFRSFQCARQYNTIKCMFYQLCNDFKEECTRLIQYFNSRRTGEKVPRFYQKWIDGVHDEPNIDLSECGNRLITITGTKLHVERIMEKMWELWRRKECVFSLDTEDMQLLRDLNTVQDISFILIDRIKDPKEQIVQKTKHVNDEIEKFHQVFKKYAEIRSSINTHTFQENESNSIQYDSKQLDIFLTDNSICIIKWKMDTSKYYKLNYSIEHTTEINSVTCESFSIREILYHLLKNTKRCELASYLKDIDRLHHYMPDILQMDHRGSGITGPEHDQDKDNENNGPFEEFPWS
jgi:hypothetical protein